MRKIRWIAATLAASGILMALSALSPAFADGMARFVARPVGRAVQSATAQARFPVAEWLILMLAGAVLAAFVRSMVRPRRFPGFFRGMALLVSALLLFYAAAWYPLYFAPSANPYPVAENVAQEELEALCQRLIAILPGEAGEAELPGKAARYPELLRAAGLSGIYIPFTGEAVYRADSAGCAFTARHESMHADFIADEGQANIAAYLACREEGGEAAYFARLYALKCAVRRLGEASPALAARYVAGLSGSVRRDFFATGGGNSQSASLFSFLARGVSDYGDLADYLARNAWAV